MYKVGDEVFFAYKLQRAVVLELMSDWKIKVQLANGEESIEFEWQAQKVVK
jgi:hypothetical protein